jgi:membrane-bound serine protease (ClpP class)
MAMMRLRAGPMLAAMALAWLALPQEAPAAIAQRALLLEIDGVIGPPIADYIEHEVGVARPDQVRVIIMRMNTPGGLDTSMRQIISAILASPVPVVTYVAPNGARAASAGAYIAYASAIAAMAPGTNIGAATPVQLGGNPLLPSDEGQKKEQKPQESKPGEPADAEARKAVNGIVAGAAIGSAALLLLVLAALLPSRRRPVVTGSEALIGVEGETVSWQDGACSL